MLGKMVVISALVESTVQEGSLRPYVHRITNPLSATKDLSWVQ